MPITILVICCSLWGCGDSGPSGETMALGQEVYNRPASCVTCHQSIGQGQPPQFPPLRANPSVVSDDTERLIKIVTHGMSGPIEVKGEKYDSVMAGLGNQLSPEEIAAVLTYVRNNWRNEASEITAEEVRAVQAKYPDRKLPWTVAELDGLPADTAQAGGAHEAAEADTSDPIAWGHALYNGAAMCATCHQPNGQGIEGAYPPLAGTPWVTGDHNRLIKIALHGISGEIEVLGKSYSNEMPGQGGLLTDEEMAATLTYVRQAWGNEAAPIYADQVAALRAKYADRHEPWPGPELAAVDNVSPLTNVRFRRIDMSDIPEGLHLNTPEFDALPVIDEGEIESNYFDTTKIAGHHEKDALFAVVFEGELEVPAEDQYHFALEGAGTAVLVVGDEAVVNQPDIKSKWLNKKATKLMSPGTHQVKLYYHQGVGWKNLKASARADSVSRTKWAITPKPTNDMQLSNPNYLLVPERDEPILLRGRFEGLGHLGMAVGHPLRVNYAYDFSRSQLTRAWQGEYLNAAAVWLGRNDKHMGPEGSDALDLTTRQPVAILASLDADWPGPVKVNQSPEGYEFIGHRVVDKLPVFYSKFFDGVLSDRSVPQTGSLTRTLEVNSPEASNTLVALLAEGAKIEDLGQGTYQVDGSYRVVVDASSPLPEIRRQGDRDLLVAPAAWEDVSIDLPSWILSHTELEPQSPGHRATWAWEYQWID
ncbi:mono/diheme cytochrome c family protein [Algisphaera agarilytica]|uniref:Mono/diheme cytochrome c family protein n=2 Tax=Algisphaera agarilytica TaxID=1385975 RepID=A0A7X0LML4_9BACT|nr:mono/diheme cytochrome c family protein [Algisphaera agarilytica]